MKFKCTHCHGSISAGPEWFGQSTTCPHCGGEIRVPNTETAPLVGGPPLSALPQLKPTTAWRARLPFLITVAVILIGYAVFRQSLPSGTASSNKPRSANPIVLSNGYEMSSISGRGRDSQIHKFEDAGSYNAWKEQEREAAAAETLHARQSQNQPVSCSFCSGTGRNSNRSIGKCLTCRGAGTRSTPSGYVMTCGSCGGTGNEKHDPTCPYCKGTGKIGLP